jgi:hypothetical protein
MYTNNIIVSSADDISNTVNEIKLRIPTPYSSQNGDMIALSSMSLYFSWFSVNSTFNNKSFSYVWTDGVTYPVVMSDGNYTLDQISQYLQFVMLGNGHYLVDSTGTNVFFLGLATNGPIYAAQLNCTAIPSALTGTYAGWTNPASVVLNGKVPQLVTGTNNWAKLIGFANSTSFPATLSTAPASFTSTTTAQISPVTKVYVGCDWVNQTKFSKYGSIIQSYVPTAPFLSLLSFIPTTLLWYPITEGTYTTISIKLYDQNFNPLVLNDVNQNDFTLIVQSTRP